MVEVNKRFGLCGVTPTKTAHYANNVLFRGRAPPLYRRPKGVFIPHKNFLFYFFIFLGGGVLPLEIRMCAMLECQCLWGLCMIFMFLCAKWKKWPFWAIFGGIFLCFGVEIGYFCVFCV